MGRLHRGGRSGEALVFILGGLAASPVLAGTIRHDLTHTPYLQYGEQPEFQSAGAVYVVTDLGVIFGEHIVFSQTIASGVLIAPDWVLTAAHVVDALVQEQGAFTQMGVVVGEQDPNVASPILANPRPSFYDIDMDNTFVHPGWTAAKQAFQMDNPGADEEEVIGFALTQGYDLALIHLHDPVTGIMPATVYTGNNEIGKVGTYVGYGMRGDGISGSLIADDLRRAGNNTIDLAGGNNPSGSGGFDWASDRILFADFDDLDDLDGINLMGDAEPLDLEYAIASGDSGGPVFVDGNGPVLVGINSFVGAFGPGDPLPGDNNPDSSYGDFVGVTRVSAFNDWIGTTMASVPEPGTAGVIALGGLFLLRRSRKPMAR
jgi:hypothetical protein